MTGGIRVWSAMARGGRCKYCRKPIAHGGALLMAQTKTARPITAGQLGRTKHRAIFLLFLSGMRLSQIGRLFRVPALVVVDVIRRSSRRGMR